PAALWLGTLPTAPAQTFQAGVPLWTNFYSGPANGEDLARAVAVDRNGNVFVAGYTDALVGAPTEADYLAIRYSSAGEPIWTNRFNGPASIDDSIAALAVDGSGNVIVTGSSGYSDGITYGSGYLTIKYSGTGVPLWTNIYSGPDTDS